MGVDFVGTERFQLLRRLGTGGMGDVYEAIDKERNTHVALKLLASLTADALLRFKREFRDFQDLSHPNLVNLGEAVALPWSAWDAKWGDGPPSALT